MVGGLALAGVALLTAGAALEFGEVGNELVISLGGALVIAGVLGATVDAWLKHQLLRDAFQATFGYVLPDELRGELSWIYAQELVCVEHRQEVELEPTADPDVLMARNRILRRVRNVSTRALEWNQSYSVEDWQHPGHAPAIHSMSVQHADRGAREDDFELDEPDPLVLRATPSAKIELRPGEEVIATADAREPKRVSDDLAFVLSQPTRNPRVSVSAPADFGYRVYFGNRETDRLLEVEPSSFELPGTLLPGQLITVRWWREARGDAGQPTDRH